MGDKFWLAVDPELYHHYIDNDEIIFTVKDSNTKYFDNFDELLEYLIKKSSKSVFALRCILPEDQIKNVVRLANNNLLDSMARVEKDYFEVEVLETWKTKDYSDE